MLLSVHLIVILGGLRLFEVTGEHEQLLELLLGDRLQELFLVVARQELLQLLEELGVDLILQ